jgi:hypothetical protein
VRFTRPQSPQRKRALADWFAGSAARRSPDDRSDYAEQPEDQDQDQQSAKTDIHVLPPLCFWNENREHGGCVPTVSETVRNFARYDFTRLKAPDLLDFPALDRK